MPFTVIEILYILDASFTIDSVYEHVLPEIKAFGRDGRFMHHEKFRAPGLH